MLLSIDRVLQLLSEGKTIGKISEMAQCAPENVVDIIEEARKLLSKHEKPLSKKKIIIKKNKDNNYESSPQTDNGDNDSKNIFNGAELSAVPLASSLIAYTSGISNGNPGPAGIGIVIYDKDDHQVGKVSTFIGKLFTTNTAIYMSIIRALKIAIYFKTQQLRIRTDSEFIVKQVNGELAIEDHELKKLYNLIHELMEKISNCSVEHVTKSFSEKSEHFARKGASSFKK